MAILNLVASGNIYPCRFACIDPADSFKALQCTATANGTEKPIGVTQEGTDWPPITDSHITNAGYAAIDGENVRIFPAGENPLLELGYGGCSAGDQLKPDADGKGVKVVTAGSVETPQYYGAIALQSGSSGEKIRVFVQPAAYTYHA